MYVICYVNCDDCVYFWINNCIVDFEGEGVYD